MTDFKPGDRVRRVAPAPYGTSRTEEAGTVTSVESPYTVNVRWEDGHIRGVWPSTIALEHPAPAPADGETQALRGSLLALAAQVAEFTGEDVVETAKAFEAYITGGTK